MLGEDSAKEFMAVLKELRDALPSLKERRQAAQEIHQHMNAGSHAVWVVVLMAAIIGTIAFMQQPRIADHERKIDRLEDYLSAIYQINPGLKEKVEANVNDHHNHETESGKQKP